MSYNVILSDKARKVLDKWKKSNPVLVKKTHSIILELAEHPKTGSGHPEPLVGGDSVTFSRRISAKDRIIYTIREEIVTVDVISLGGHYNDK